MKRVLITRPQCKRTSSLLKCLDSLGWHAVHLPLMNYTETKRKMRFSVKGYDLLLCVSPYAAERFLQLLNEREYGSLPPVFTPGTQTAAYLRERGIRAECPVGDIGSEALLDLPRLNQVRNRKILLLKGKGGRRLLKKVLITRGADVHSCILYGCKPLYYSRRIWDEAAPLRLLWVTSGRILKVLSENIRRNRLSWIYDSLLVVGSQRLLKMKEATPFKNKTALPTPDNEGFTDYITTMDNHGTKKENG